MKCRWFLESQQGVQILGCKERQEVNPFTQVLQLLRVMGKGCGAKQGKKTTLRIMTAAQKASLSFPLLFESTQYDPCRIHSGASGAV